MAEVKPLLARGSTSLEGCHSLSGAVETKAEAEVIRGKVTFSRWSVGRRTLCRCLSRHGCSLCSRFRFLLDVAPSS